LQEKAYSFLVRNIAGGAKIKFLDLSNVKVTEVKSNFWSANEVIESDNMLAIYEILQAVTKSEESIGALEVLSLQDVVFNSLVCDMVCEIIKANHIKELLLNGCQMGNNDEIIFKLAEALSTNTSLRGIEINVNNLSDE